ncbi:MAG TPA: GIDE domain-containing protein [Terriglobales bacterium]|nr:GIDE domain-containing protein [Terriglobales bacterium]
MIVPELPIAIWASLALGGGPILLWRSLRDFRTRRLLQNTPTARIRSMPMGLVELCGEAVPRSELAAPFSGRSCAYWQVDISIRGRRDSWRVVHRDASGHPFFIRDETGVALVYPQDATVKLACGAEEVCSGASLPDCYAQYLKEHRLMFWRMNTLRFRERLLEPSDRVYVLGTATPRAQAVSISMDDEAEATGTDDRRVRRLQTLDHEVRGVIRRGENERTYLISHQSERELTMDLGLRAAAELVGGPLLTLFGLGYWADALSRMFR